MDVILIMNAGSSSLKFCVYDATGGDQCPPVARGEVASIGRHPRLIVNGEEKKLLSSAASHAVAVKEILDWIKTNAEGWRVIAAGHRIVHGGDRFHSPVPLNAAVMADLAELTPLAPLHQPHNLAAVEALWECYPGLPQIGCFDTAFHFHHDPVFRHFALPRNLREQGLRRYGFHGLSYEWIAQVLANEHPDLFSGRVVVAHLGNGASLCAMKHGKSVDTTMGMTALDGLPMGTRCGTLDPGAVLYMISNRGMSADDVADVLTNMSGLKGLSGISGDMKELLASASDEAAFAVSYFTMMTAQHVARMAVAIGGVDAIVFTGGIGEHAERIREAVLSHLEFLRPFEVIVIPANEERIIANHCSRLIQQGETNDQVA